MISCCGDGQSYGHETTLTSTTTILKMLQGALQRANSGRQHDHSQIDLAVRFGGTLCASPSYALMLVTKMGLSCSDLSSLRPWTSDPEVITSVVYLFHTLSGSRS